MEGRYRSIFIGITNRSHHIQIAHSDLNKKGVNERGKIRGKMVAEREGGLELEVKDFPLSGLL